MSITSRFTFAAGLTSAAIASVTAVGIPAQAVTPTSVVPAVTTKVIDYPNFKNGPDLALNGSAAIVAGPGMQKPGVLRLTNGKVHQAGTAWSAVPINPSKQSFESTFVVSGTHTAKEHADGVAFVVQAAGKKALGWDGGGMGYAGIRPALAVEFDTFKNVEYDPNNNHISVVTGGRAESPLATGSSPVALFGAPFRATVQYDAPTKVLRVLVNEASKTGVGTQVFAKKVDLPALLGTKPVSMGFTGGTGSTTSTQDVLSWTVTLTK